jgi:hypothetical protein
MSPRRFLSRNLRLIAVAHLMFASVSLLVAQQGPKVLAPHQPYAPNVRHSYPLPRPVSGSMVGGPWMIDGNFKSSVYIKNGVETSAVTVTPVLYLSNGVATNFPILHWNHRGRRFSTSERRLKSLGSLPMRH